MTYIGENMKIETSRLIIQKFNLEHMEDFKDIIKDFNNSKYVAYDRPFPKSDKEMELLAEKFSNNELFFEVVLKDTSKMIGYVCFYNNQNDFDIGYCFHSCYSKKGYAFESCSALIELIKLSCHVHKFTAGTALENKPSVKLLLKLGFHLVNTEKIAFQKDNSGNDVVFNGGNFELDVTKI